MGLVKDGSAPVVYTSILEINTYCMEVMGQTYASVFCIQRVLNNLWPYCRHTLAPGSLVALYRIVISGLNEHTQSLGIFPLHPIFHHSAIPAHRTDLPLNGYGMFVFTLTSVRPLSACFFCFCPQRDRGRCRQRHPSLYT